MLDFVKTEIELTHYKKHIIIHNNTRYVPAQGFELLLRLYQEQKFYRTKLEQYSEELETKLSNNTKLNRKRNIRKARKQLLKNHML